MHGIYYKTKQKNGGEGVGLCGDERDQSWAEEERATIDTCSKLEPNLAPSLAAYA